MSMHERPIVTALYVPGDRPDRFGKAAASGADVVILDLEDAVAADRKDEARRAVADYLSTPTPCPVAVRVNGAETPWYTSDLEALAHCAHVSAIRLPKCESPGQVAEASRRSGGGGVQAVIESAIGVERLYDIARAAATVSVSLGEADLRSALSITDPGGLDWVRSRLVVAASAAGLPAPLMSVWADLKDYDGLAASCRAGKTRGFLGRAAIHPDQVPVIRAAFMPTDDEILDARAILAALADAAAVSSGVAVLPNGHMVDAAMRRGAERTLALAEL
jgi:citrate lyase subunit beta/citryl-CoA lyase